MQTFAKKHKTERRDLRTASTPSYCQRRDSQRAAVRHTLRPDGGQVIQRQPVGTGTSGAAMGTHIAEPGDSLSLIAGYPAAGWRERLEQLIAANPNHPNIKNRTRDDPRFGWLEIGDVINVPWQSPPVRQPSGITVQVVEPFTLDPIRDARVQLFSGGSETELVTNGQGRAAFTSLNPALYSIRVSHPEHETQWGQGRVTPAPGRTVAIALLPRAFDLVKVPVIMRAMGWSIAPSLQDIWFAGPANSNPEAGVHVTNVVTLGWVRGFTAANTLFNDLINNRVWVNAKARAQIADWLRRNGKLTNTPQTFGNFNRPVPAIDNDHVQRGDYDAGMGLQHPLNELLGALANFNFRMAIKGSVSPQAGGKHQVHITEVGIYVRDSFDFKGGKIGVRA